jgi:hypothetical protein
LTFTDFGGIVHLMKSIELASPHAQEKSGFTVEKFAWTVGSIATALGCVLVVGNMSALDKPPVAPFSRNIDTKVGSVTVENGAQLRAEPVSDPAYNTNILLEVHPVGATKTIDIPTPDGVREFVNQDGKWFGIETADLPAEFQPAVKNDRDKIVWLNENEAVENIIK